METGSDDYFHSLIDDPNTTVECPFTGAILKEAEDPDSWSVNRVTMCNIEMARRFREVVRQRHRWEKFHNAIVKGVDYKPDDGEGNVPAMAA